MCVVCICVHLHMSTIVIFMCMLYICMCACMHVSGADLGFLRKGAKANGGSLKQGVWEAQPSRSYIGCLVFEVSKSEI